MLLKVVSLLSNANNTQQETPTLKFGIPALTSDVKLNVSVLPDSDSTAITMAVAIRITRVFRAVV